MQGWGPAYYFGPDSSSYWNPVFRAFHHLSFSISEKRPWFYPVLMLITPFGPKGPAFTAALLQHAFGLLAVFPLAATVRMTMPRWRFWVVPITLTYALSPQMLYWEHVLISDSIFIALTLAILWAFCWFWHSRRWGVLALVFCLLFLATATRPVGRAIWLTMIPLSLLLPSASWRQKGIVCALFAGLYFPASRLTHVSQGNSLMFTSVFPLIRTDSPLHADIKAELAPSIHEARTDLWGYVSSDQKQTWTWLETDNAESIGPHYAALVANRKERAKVTSEIALEAMAHQPLTYLGMIGMKIYVIAGLNTRASYFQLRSYKKECLKFLFVSLQKLDPRFPQFLLRDSRATDKDGITAAVNDCLSDTAAQARVLPLLPWLTACTSLYNLTDQSAAPQNCFLLIFFLTGVCSLPFIPEKRNFLPIIGIGLGYLVLTLLVGRAVDRYRLPAEFLFIIMVYQGCDVIWNLARGLRSGMASNTGSAAADPLARAEANGPDVSA